MALLTRDELEQLTEPQGQWCVSIFMPTVRAGRETRQNATRFKNLVADAEEQLRARELTANEVRALLQPARDLSDDKFFWQEQTEGLASFLSTEGIQTYHLPDAVDEQAVVADRFHIRPLLPLLNGDGQYYILALAQGEIRLLRGTRHEVTELEPEGIPESLQEALRWDDPEAQLQWHSSTDNSAGQQGENPAVYHGSGDESERRKVDILRFFQQVDAGVRDLLAGDEVPLVLAGVEYLLPIYREANKYPHLAAEWIPENTKLVDAEELHRRSWGIVEPLFQAEQHHYAELFQQLRGQGSEHVAESLAAIVPAAHYARIGELFVRADAPPQWGRYDLNEERLEVHDQQQPNSLDLIDDAAVQTLRQGGLVFAVGADDMPTDGPVAAILRF